MASGAIYVPIEIYELLRGVTPIKTIDTPLQPDQDVDQATRNSKCEVRQALHQSPLQWQPP